MKIVRRFLAFCTVSVILLYCTPKALAVNELFQLYSNPNIVVSNKTIDINKTMNYSLQNEWFDVYYRYTFATHTIGVDKNDNDITIPTDYRKHEYLRRSLLWNSSTVPAFSLDIQVNGYRDYPNYGVANVRETILDGDNMGYVGDSYGDIWGLPGFDLAWYTRSNQNTSGSGFSYNRNIFLIGSPMPIVRTYQAGDKFYGITRPNGLWARSMDVIQGGDLPAQWDVDKSTSQMFTSQTLFTLTTERVTNLQRISYQLQYPNDPPSEYNKWVPKETHDGTGLALKNLSYRAISVATDDEYSGAVRKPVSTITYNNVRFASGYWHPKANYTRDTIINRYYSSDKYVDGQGNARYPNFENVEPWYMDVGVPTVFNSCTFTGNVFAKPVFNGKITLNNCTINGNVMLDNTTMSGAIQGSGSLTLNNCSGTLDLSQWSGNSSIEILMDV